MAHGVLMGVLSIVAGVMLTLASAGPDTGEYNAAVQAAAVTQQNEDNSANCDDSKDMLVTIQFNGFEDPDTGPTCDSSAVALQIRVSPELRTSS